MPRYASRAFDVEALLTETYDWNRLTERVAAETGLDDSARAAAILGIASLRRHLGEDWPLSEIATGHPLLEYFTNRAEWTRDHLAHLGQALDALSSLPGSESVVRRLAHSRESHGALLEIELAYPSLARLDWTSSLRSRA